MRRQFSKSVRAAIQGGNAIRNPRIYRSSIFATSINEKWNKFQPCVQPLMLARFYTTDTTNSEGSSSSLGCVDITMNNYAEEVRHSDIPTLLYMHVTSHPEVAKYTSYVKHQVAQVNTTHPLLKGETIAGGPPKLLFKLAMVDCEAEPTLAQRFGVTEDQFPVIFFVYGGSVVDRLVGIVPESQIKDGLNAFTDFVKLQMVEQADQIKRQEKLEKMSNDEENALTLLQAAASKMRDKDYAKAEYLYQKVYNISSEQIVQTKKNLGLDKKKMTPELQEKLKKDPHYHACPQSIVGLALCAMALKQKVKAIDFCKQLRKDYPWAIRDMKEVAEAVCKMELLELVDYDVEKDGYVNLMKKDDYLNEPVKFYNNNVKLCIAHFVEQNHELAIDECLKLVRIEPKILGKLKAAGVVGENTKTTGLDSQEGTPARRVLATLLEYHGPTHDFVVKARKKMAAFMFT